MDKQMNSKEVAFKLQVLYNKLATYNKVEEEIKEQDDQFDREQYWMDFYESYKE